MMNGTTCFHFIVHRSYFIVRQATPLGFEPRQREPKSLVLPLHYGVVVNASHSMIALSSDLGWFAANSQRARRPNTIDTASPCWFAYLPGQHTRASQQMPRQTGVACGV